VPAFERGADAKPNANTADAITISFFSMIDITPVVWLIEPNNHRVVAQKRGAPEIIHRRQNGDIFARCLSWVSDLGN
jgi:hypothetical protein